MMYDPKTQLQMVRQRHTDLRDIARRGRRSRPTFPIGTRRHERRA